MITADWDGKELGHRRGVKVRYIGVVVLMLLGIQVAQATGISGIPAKVLAQIEAECAKRHPQDEVMQHACVSSRLELWMKARFR
jgi:hypothetical protein